MKELATPLDPAFNSHVQLISMTKVDWKFGAQLLEQASGLPITKEIKTRNPDSPEAILQLFNLAQGLNVHTILGRYCNYLHFGFLILNCHQDHFERFFHPMATLSIGKGSIAVFGSLEDWHKKITQILVEGSPPFSISAVVILNKIFMQFTLIGLRDIWGEYTRIDQNDGTFTLQIRGT